MIKEDSIEEARKINERGDRIKEIKDMNPYYPRLGCLFEHRYDDECLTCNNSISGRRINENGEEKYDISKRGVCRDMLEGYGINLNPYD